MLRAGADAHRGAPAGGRNETPDERADRNWNEVLQELRVLQTGTQILTGFLLALAFQPAFDKLADAQRVIYLVLIVLSGLSAIVALAPVALHRILFRQHAKSSVVGYGHGSLITALALVSLLLVGVVVFVFDVVVGFDGALWVGSALAVLILVLWAAVPLTIRALRRKEKSR